MAHAPGQAVTSGSDRRVLQIPIGQLIPARGQPRQIFDETALEELAASIRLHGVLQPLLVTKLSDGAGDNNYGIVAGERRWRAATIARLPTVPALLLDIDEQLSREVALIENIHRCDLGPLELAQAYESLLRSNNLTHDVLAKRIGKNRVSVTNTLRLLGLGFQAQHAMTSGKISEGHGRALLAVSGELQDRALARVIEQRLSVRQTETLARRISTPHAAGRTTRPRTNLRLLEDALRNVLGAPVYISGAEDSGRIAIAYHSREELERLCERIGGDDLARELS